MGRSLVNSRVCKKLKQQKRATLAPLLNEKILGLFNDIQTDLAGNAYRKVIPKNAFLHPDDPEAAIPQYNPAPIIDLRGFKSELAGKEFRGAGSKHKKTLGHIVEVIVYDQNPDLQNLSGMQTEGENNVVERVEYRRPVKGSKKNMSLAPDKAIDESQELANLMGGLKVGGKKNKVVESKEKSGMATENLGVAKKINKKNIRKNRPKAF